MSAPMPASSTVKSRRLSGLLPAAISILVVLWQINCQFRVDPNRLRYPMRASIGLYPELIAEVWPFYYYGVFPVCTPASAPESKPQADEFIAHRGDLLAMDLNLPCSMVRHGDFGRLWLLVPSVWLSGDPLRPSVVRVDETLFILALLAVLWAFWREGMFLQGLLIVLFVGSDPFQQEQLAQENIFSLPITFALFALAGNLPLITGRIGVRKLAWLIAGLSGILLATVRDIRAEAAMAVLTLPLIYLTIPGVRWPRRLALVAVLVGGYLATTISWNAFWTHKVDEARAWVAERGGHPYNGFRTSHHTLWHVIWEGLGDFDTRFGYAWDDRKAFAYAAPILRSRFGLNMTYTEGYHSDQKYPDGYYFISLEDLPQYTATMRQKVLHDVTHHPAWYLTILLQRAWATLSHAVPVTLELGPLILGDPYLVYVAPLAWCLLLWRRKWTELKIIFVSLSTSFTSLFVYSGQGTTYWGIFHLVTMAVLAAWGWSWWVRRRAKLARA